MNVSLTPSLEIFVRECAESGDYNNASEVVREALRLLKRHQEFNAAKLKALQNAISVGDRDLADGRSENLRTEADIDRFFAAL